MFRNAFFLTLGFLGGLWLSWPGITSRRNWVCAKDIVLKAHEEKVDFRAVLAISPKYVLKNNDEGVMNKVRIVGDACFR